jgi:molecular chaperone GrpE
MYPSRYGRTVHPERVDVEAIVRAAEDLRQRAIALEQALGRAERAVEASRAEIADLRRAHDAAVASRDAAIAARDAAIVARDAAIAERDAARRASADVEARPAPADDRLERLAADLANVRRHTDERVARARASERAHVIAAVFDTYDLVRAALDSNPDHASEWARGHRAILDQLESRLRGLGFEPVGVVGERFDPSAHEAVGLADGPADTVVAVLQRGFRGDGADRPARVLVGRGPTPASA